MAASTAGYTNITISVPPGSTNHGNPHLLCVPPRCYDFLLFFVANYFAHAATIIAVPGQHWFETLEVAVMALLWPVSGMTRAITTIFNHAMTERDVVKRAARAGALCMVGRTRRKTHPFAEREWWDVEENITKQWTVDESKSRLHGSYRLKKGYCLLPVPAIAAVSAPAASTGASHYILGPSHNILKLLVSFIQALWALVTLYRARGDQIDHFGYAAFGLTVAQYAFMSIINIIGNLLQPEYSSLFMVRTPLMNEAEEAGCYFEGEINVQIHKGKSPDELAAAASFLMGLSITIGALLGLTIFAIIGGLSSFKKQDSTPLERGFTMSWLVVSILFGPFLRFSYVNTRYATLGARIFFLSFYIILFGTPAIGGMVVVGRMIQRFGICTLVGTG